MTHAIAAIIGAPAVIARVADAAGCPAPQALPFGLAIVPLGHAQIDRLTDLRPGAYLEGFTYLSERLGLAFSKMAGDGMLTCIETDYFGGKGSQAAAVFVHGRVTLNASGHHAPINTALHSPHVTRFVV